MKAIFIETEIAVFPVETAGGSPESLDLGEVHVWHARLDRFESLRNLMIHDLSADELLRSQKFRFDRDRQRYEIGRGLLRAILARYVGGSPRAIELRYGAHGKPRLAGNEFAFNLSHSDDLALIAVARPGAIGVDVEAIRPMPQADRLVARFFSKREQEVIVGLAEPDRLLGFFTCWTRKEACIKAVGLGLSIPLDGFDVTAVPGSEPKLLRVDRAPDEPARWSFADLPVDDGFLGVVAIDRPIRSIRFRRLVPN